MSRLFILFFILCICVGCQETPISTSSKTEETEFSAPDYMSGDETDSSLGRNDERALTIAESIDEDVTETEDPLLRESASSNVEKELSQIASLFMKTGSDKSSDLPRGSWSFSVYNPQSGYTYYYDGYNNLLEKKSR